MILFAFLFAIFMNIKKAYKERNNILNNKYKVVNDTCLNIEKMKLTMTDLLLHTLGILRIQKVKFHDTSITSTLRSINPKKFILVFLEGESQPTLFYNAEKFYYEETV